MQLLAGRGNEAPQLGCHCSKVNCPLMLHALPQHHAADMMTVKTAGRDAIELLSNTKGHPKSLLPACRGQREGASRHLRYSKESPRFVIVRKLLLFVLVGWCMCVLYLTGNRRVPYPYIDPSSKKNLCG